jgi:hypothetical protein
MESEEAMGRREVCVVDLRPSRERTLPCKQLLFLWITRMPPLSTSSHQQYRRLHMSTLCKHLPETLLSVGEVRILRT